MLKKSGISIFFIGITLVLLLIVISTTIGYANISISQTFKILINAIYKIFDTSDFPINSEINILKVRLPRVLGAGLTGMGLTLAGIIFQSILRNPMAEPYILGVSSGAAIGAAISILTGFTVLFIPLTYTTPFFALVGALIASFAVIFISGNNFNTSKIILYGVSFNFFLSSLLTLLISFNINKTNDILFWTLGSFAPMNYTKVTIIFITVLISGIFTLYFSKELNLFTLGSSIATTLGLNIRKYRIILLTIASVLTGVIVAFTGIIGFVGLIIPHLSRLFVGSEHKRIITLSLPLGAGFMILCDTFSRSIFTNELPVGVITSLIGAPIFIFLLKRKSTI